jgi:hypothetical protein
MNRKRLERAARAIATQGSGLMTVTVIDVSSLVALLTLEPRWRALVSRFVDQVEASQELPLCLLCPAEVGPGHGHPSRLVVVRAAVPDAGQAIVNVLCVRCADREAEIPEKLRGLYPDLRVLDPALVHRAGGKA